MWGVFSKSKQERKAKEIILRGFFNSANQKKAMKKAARESTDDQKKLLEKYQNMKMKSF